MHLVTPLLSSLIPTTSKRNQQQKHKARRMPYHPPEDADESSRDIALPRGVWWLKHKNVENEALFGDSFVIHRLILTFQINFNISN